MKKILIISTSLRSKSNSHLLAEEFARGAKEVGNEVELVSLRNAPIAFCRGCLACQKTGKCVIDDAAVAIADKMARAEVIVWATPVYYYSVSGQMKTLIDRANSLYTRDYNFRSVYLIATATEDEAFTPEGAEKCVQGWVDCFERAKFEKTLFVGGVTDPGDVLKKGDLAKAYELGKSVR